jgi:hypothetical protein
MFRIDLSKLAKFNDDTVLKAASKDELKDKVRDHFRSKNPQRWNAMTDEEKTKLRSKLSELIESR